MTTNPRGITVTDQRGRTIVFDQPVSRVVTLPKPAAAMLIAIDKSSEHLAGMHDASWVAMRDGILGKMFPEALKIPHDVAGNGFAPNVESILALKPDVVVQWGDHGAGVVAPLENAGLTVLELSYGTQDDLTAWIKLFAAMLGKPERAHGMLTMFDAKLEHVESLTSSVSAAPPKVLSFIEFGGLEVAGNGTYNDWYIKLVGATNSASGIASKATQGFVRVSVEQVLAWNPDIILLGKNDYTMPEDVYADEVWENMSAVRSRRVYRVPLGGYPWDAPSQESPLMWQWLSQVAFPEHKSSDLRDQIVSYYQFLYGYRPSNAQMDTILWAEANGESAHYQQFDAR